MKIKVGILGCGYFVPPTIVTNSDLAKVVDASDDWIVSRTGIKERRIANNQTASDLACEAAKDALCASGLTPQDVDCIIVATITPDMPWPSTACFVQHKLGINNIPAYDVGAACSGFVFALNQAKAFVSAGVYKHVLVIGAEKFSSYLDWQDRNSCVLFADGAGAVVVGPSDDSEIFGIHLGADGSKADILKLPGIGHINAFNQVAEERKVQFLQMEGKEVYKNAVEKMPLALELALEKSKLKISDLDYFVFHQANLRIIEFITKKYKLPEEKMVINISKYGNTSAATIPIALAEAIKDGKIKKGSLVGISAFGAGTTWGAAILKI